MRKKFGNATNILGRDTNLVMFSHGHQDNTRDTEHESTTEDLGIEKTSFRGKHKMFCFFMH